MLHVLDHDRPAAARDIEQPLYAQQISTAQRGQRFHRARKSRPLDRLGHFDDEARDAVAVLGLGDEA